MADGSNPTSNLVLHPGDREVLARGLKSVLGNCKSDEEFAAAERLSVALGAEPSTYGPYWFIGCALDQQNDRLFNAEAIIQCVASSIEEQLSDLIDQAPYGGIPNYCRALTQAVELIRAAYVNLDMVALRAIAEQIEKAQSEAEGQEVEA